MISVRNLRRFNLKNHTTLSRKSYNQIGFVTLLDYMQFCLKATQKYEVNYPPEKSKKACRGVCQTLAISLHFNNLEVVKNYYTDKRFTDIDR